jgi:hypothetical protein
MAKKQRPKQKQKAPTASGPIEQLAGRLTMRRAIPTGEPTDIVGLIYSANLAAGWRPPKGLFLNKREALQAVRRAAIGVILDNAPPEYQRQPRGKNIFNYVREELGKLSPRLAEQEFSDETIQKDIEDWAYYREIGKQKVREARAAKPPPTKAKVRRKRPTK